MTTPTKIKELKVQPRWAEEGGGGGVGKQGPGKGSRAGLQAGRVTSGVVSLQSCRCQLWPRLVGPLGCGTWPRCGSGAVTGVHLNLDSPELSRWSQVSSPGRAGAGSSPVLGQGWGWDRLSTSEPTTAWAQPTTSCPGPWAIPAHFSPMLGGEGGPYQPINLTVVFVRSALN